MGAAVGGPKGGGRRRSRPMSDINVTPMVDVMLVLLIIFMVTAPLLTTTIEVDTPKVNAPPGKNDPDTITLVVKPDGTIYLQNTQLQLEEIAPKMQAILASKPNNAVYLKGDKGAGYGRVMEVMGALNSAGIHKVGLITSAPDTPGAAPRKGAR